MPNVTLKEVTTDGVSPEGFYLTTHMPTYYKYNDNWIIPKVIL